MALQSCFPIFDTLESFEHNVHIMVSPYLHALDGKQTSHDKLLFLTTSPEIYTFQAWWCRNCMLKRERCPCGSKYCRMQLSSVTELTWLVLQSERMKQEAVAQSLVSCVPIRTQETRDCTNSKHAQHKKYNSVFTAVSDRERIFSSTKTWSHGRTKRRTDMASTIVHFFHKWENALKTLLFLFHLQISWISIT
jgi:hypothetical protein